MSEPSRTKSELIKEISVLKKRIEELEQSEIVRKGAEEELKFSRQQLQLLINAGPDFFFLKDLDLRYQLVNSANAGFFGLDEAGILGRTDVELMPEGAAVVCQESDRLAICEKRMVVTNESIGDRFYETRKFPVIIADKIVGVAGIIRDITERKQAEEALRESEERQNTILSNVGAYIFLKDTRYRYTYVNRKVCNLFGLNEDDIIGKDDASFFSDASVEEIRSSDRRVIEGGETIALEEVGLISSDKVPRTYWVVKLPLRDSGGNICGLCGISTEITDLKQAEEALRTSESNLRTILDSIDDAIFIHTVHGEVVDVNDKMLDMYRVSREEALSMTILKDFSASDNFSDTLSEIWQSVMRGEKRVVEGTTHRPHDNSIFSVEVFLRKIQLNNADFILAMVRDITERKKSEETFRASQIQLSEAMDLAHIVYWESDPIAKTFTLNDRFYTFYGTSAEQEGGYRMTIEDYAKRFIYPDDLPLFYQGLDQNHTKSDSGEPLVDIEHRIIRRDGEVRHILAQTRIIKDDSGRFVRIYGASQDITERKWTEVALKESETKFRQIAEASAVGIYLIQDGIFKYVNKRFADIYGYPIEEILDRRGPPELTLPEDLPRVQENIRKKLSGENPMVHYEFRIVTQENKIRYAEIFSSTSTYQGKPSIMGTLLDITERKLVEKALQESEAKYRNVVEYSLIGFYILDGPYFQFVNKRFCEMFGYSEDEIIGKLGPGDLTILKIEPW